MKSASSFIKSLFETGDSAILCGAGISRESGIPTVYCLLREICRVASYDSEAIIERLSTVQFEHIISTIRQQADITGLLEVFDGSFTNIHHQLYAHLASQNLVRLILTTNFDCLIEKALNDNNSTFKRLASRDQLIEGICNNDHSVDLIKLHGSIDQPGNLAATIEYVSNYSQAGIISPLIESTLRLKKIKYLVIFGYSMSDYFDVVPALRENCGDTRIIYWKHTASTPDSQYLEDEEAQGFLRGDVHGSMILSGDTSKLAHSLLSSFGGELKAQNNPSLQNWNAKVESWWSLLSNSKKLGVRASLAVICGNICDSLGFSEAGLESAMLSNQVSSAASHACTIGIRLLERCEFPQAGIYFNWIIDQGEIIPKHILVTTRLQNARRLAEMSEYGNSVEQCFHAMVELRGTPFFALAPKDFVDPLEDEAPLWSQLMATTGISLYMMGEKESGMEALSSAIEIAKRGGMLKDFINASRAKARLLAQEAVKYKKRSLLVEAQNIIIQLEPFVTRIFPLGSVLHGEFVELKFFVNLLAPMALAFGLGSDDGKPSLGSP